jgi:hypothetical protein
VLAIDGLAAGDILSFAFGKGALGLGSFVWTV